MTPAEQLVTLIGDLAARIPDGDLTPAIGIINDIGRLIRRADKQQLRVIQSALGTTQLLLDQTPPAQQLKGDDAQTFLAGALWAVCDILDQQS